MEKIYCMVIGDIISSKKIDLKTRANIQSTLKQTLQKINFDYDKYICSRFSLTLGDELQGGLYTIYPLFDILNRIKQSIYPYKIRFGIGIDTMTTEIQYYDSLASDGSAYYYARNAVEILKHTTTNEFGYQFGSSKSDLNYANDLIRLIDCISQTWTKTQKEYISKLQENPDLELSVIAKAMNVNISSVSRAISKSNYRLISEVLNNLRHKINRELFISELQDEFQAQYNRACELIENRDFESAKKILTNPTKNDESVEYYSLLSTIHNAQRKYNVAIDCAKKAINFLDNNNSPKKIRLLNILGICYTDIEEYELAKEKFAEAMQILEINNSTESWKMYTLGNLARLYSKMGDYQNAENLLKEVLLILDNSFPNDSKSRISLLSIFGKLYHRWGKNDISLKMYESAIQLSECIYEKNAERNAVLKYNFAKLLIDMDYANFMRIYNLLLEASESFKKNSMIYFQKSCYKLILDLCKKHGENFKAEEFKNKIIKLKDE